MLIELRCRISKDDRERESLSSATSASLRLDLRKHSLYKAPEAVLIAHNQIHKLLKGLPPIRSLVAVGTSAAKLVSLPVKNYKKDRRIVN
ncbi:autophagy-related protein 2, partial [Tanacetum coccineum]